jgi:hypothetical protein
MCDATYPTHTLNFPGKLDTPLITGVYTTVSLSSLKQIKIEELLYVVSNNAQNVVGNHVYDKSTVYYLSI